LSLAWPKQGNCPRQYGGRASQDPNSLQQALQKHVGTHLQSLAMISLPWDASQAGSAVPSNDAQKGQDDVRAVVKEIDSMLEDDAVSNISFTPSDERATEILDDNILDYSHNRGLDDLASVRVSWFRTDPAAQISQRPVTDIFKF
jgi:hypothetical protein